MMNYDDPRRITDPDERYGSEGARRVDQQAVRVLSLYPEATFERTRDVIQISIGADKGTVLLVTAEDLELRLPTVEWTQGAYGPELSSRFWKRLSWESLEDGDLKEAIDQAIAARQEEFQECRYCGTSVPPEHQFEKDVCQGCASEHFGVVY